MANGTLGAAVLREVLHAGDTLAALVLHPPERRRDAHLILDAAGMAESEVIDGSKLEDREVLHRIRLLEPDLGISALFGYIVRKSLLSLIPGGFINLHPAYLPFNRGAHPNVWSIIDGTPAGVTLHYMDEGVDTGPIIAQTKVEVEPVDTGETLHAKLEAAALDLFRRQWPLVRGGGIAHLAQPDGGTRHYVGDLQRLDRINLDHPTTARQLLNQLRARTFAGYPGAFFVANGRKVYVRVQLEYGDAVDSTEAGKAERTRKKGTGH